MKIEFPWKRYWCPSDKELLLREDGYLWNPESAFGSWVQEHLKPVSSLVDEPCLILLGEPGSGKSTEVKREATRQKENGQITAIIDLRSVQRVEEIGDEPIVQAWLTGEGALTLFLDSFDECQIPPAILCDKLCKWLGGLPYERLHLRIACRSADWPHGLIEEGLKSIFKEQKEYEIAPLDREAVHLAIETYGLSSEDTFKVFDELDLGSFAAKPLTLEMLLSRLRRGEKLPKERRELFYGACLALCEEQNEARRANKDSPRRALDSKHRLIVAARIAAYMLLLRREAVRTFGHPGKNDLSLADISGGKEEVEGAKFTVDAKAVEEVLSTGLFTLRGANRMGWSHQAYPDFLAAWYFSQRGLPPQQIESLLQHSPSRRIIPHLGECAAWLASMDRMFLESLKKHDLSILLRADSAALNNEDRRGVLQALLRAFDQKEISYRQMGLRKGYKNLSYPEMAQDLRPYIIEPTYNWVVRQAAIDFAEDCQISELIDSLLAVVLNPTEDIHIREQAARAIEQIGSPEVKRKLAPLLEDVVESPTQQELMGIVLDALYPESINLQEALDYIAKRADDGVLRLGTWEHFQSRLKDSLGDEGLVQVLKWTESLGQPEEVHSSTKRFMEDIFARGWERMDIPGVADALAKALATRLRLEGGWVRVSAWFPEEPNDEQRMKIVRFAVERDLIVDDEPYALTYARPPLIRTSDLGTVRLLVDGLFCNLEQ